jgi:hypothetical protein
MSLGEIVWSAIAGFWVLWVLAARLHFSLLGPLQIFRWLLLSKLGRALCVVAWAGAGWHLFCQRP